MGEPLDLELLISVTAGLGSFQEDEGGNEVYVKDDDCAACLRDLQRFLRQDDPQEREAFLALGKHNIAKTDLVPIIVTYPTDTELVYNALKVVTFMTMPVDALSDNRTLQVEYMQQVKEAFLGQDAMAVVVGLVADPLGRHPRMNEKDVLIVQLVIAFIRNLLCVPDRAADAGSKGDHKTRLRQELLERLFEDHVMELLILIAQHMHEHPFKKEAPLLLQIFHEIFKGIDPKEMLQATYTPPATRVSAKERPHGAGIATEKAILQREQRMIKASLQSRPMVRHARFGGVYVRRHVDDAMQTVLHSAHGGGLPSVARQARAKAATQVVEAEPRAKLAARLLVRMREYAEQFLEVSYDIMMGILRKDLEPGLNISRLDRVDFLRFLRLAHFFTAFLRMRQERDYKAQHAAKKAAPAAAPGPEADAEAAKAALSPFACISATMGFETFHMVQVLWLGIIDMPTKSEEKDWELQHASLSLLKEMLFTLDLATFAGNASDKKAADRLQRRLLHDDMKESGLLPVLGRLIKGFHYKFQPRSHAADLVEAIHVVLRMLDRLNTKEAGGFLVKRKAAVRRRKLPKTPAPAPPADPDAEANGETPGPAGDRPEGAPSAEKATPAPRAIPPEDGDAASAAGDSPASGSGQEREEQGTIAGGRVGDPFEEIEEEEEMEAARRRVKEVAYDVKQRVRQELAFPAVVHFYTWLLQGYSTNSTFLNHCILGFLKRIAHPDHLNLEPMLYQLSVLRLFHEILADDLFRKVPHAPELLHFCIGVTRNLFARLVPALPKAPDKGDELGDDMEVDVEGGDLHDKQEAEQRAAKEAKVKEGASSMMFIELMFWKNAKDSEQVRDEYNWKHLYDWEARQRDALHSLRNDQSDGELPGVGPARKRNGAFSLASRFSDAQLKQLRDLFEEHSAKKGYAAIIAEELGGGLKRSQVARQLKAMGFKQGVLTDTQKARLLELYEEFKYDKKYLTLIAEQLPGGWRKGQVGSQLRKLGLTKQRAPRAEGAGTGGKGKKVKKIKMPKVGADGQLLSSSESSSGSSSAGSGSDGSGSDGSGSASSGSDSDAEPQDGGKVAKKAKQARVVVELGDNAKRAQSGEPGKRAAKKAKAGEGSAQAGVSGVQQDVLAAIKARRMRKQVPAQDQPGVQQPAADVDMADAPASADDELLALLEDEVAAGATQAPAAAAPAPAGQTDEDLLQDLLDEGDNGRNTETLPLRESVDAGNRPASELVAQPVAKRRILKKAVEPLATAAAAYEDLEDF
ncbi:hypothetical protein WJX72_011470 [[Myrmecia] bisecta]|uniref:Timeless N-terminal domain-containing protein n=1 Tax=[Myrmecia] bisecta TaxID=41462 RepID=A0AAW1RAK0_9CHLO